LRPDMRPRRVGYGILSAAAALRIEGYCLFFMAKMDACISASLYASFTVDGTFMVGGNGSRSARNPKLLVIYPVIYVIALRATSCR
jgi:hypothetical protein